VAKLVYASDLGSVGCGFKSLHSHLFCSMTEFEKFVYLFNIKLKVFERRVILPLNKWLRVELGWRILKNSLIRNRRNMFDDLEAEFMPTDDFHVAYIVFYKWLSFFIATLGSLLAVFLLRFYPMSLADQAFDFLEFCWATPLVALLLLLLTGLVILSVVPIYFFDFFCKTAFFFSSVVLIFSTSILCRFDFSSDCLQFAYQLSLDFEDDWRNIYVETRVVNTLFAGELFNLHIGVDGFSLLLLFLSSFLFFICAIINLYTAQNFIKERILLFFLLEFFVSLAFVVFDLVAFYVAFEGALLPMFLIIGLFGGRSRRVYAAFKLFFYTFFFSIFTLFGLLVLVTMTGFTDLDLLVNFFFPTQTQKLFFALFFLAFAVKLPMVPLYFWLPEAHVEAPTTGSIILAGVLLKLGGYGFFRFLWPLFPEGFVYFAPLIQLLSILAILLASLAALRQIDLKKTIAYSSIAHMGVVTLVLTCPSLLAFSGAFFILLSHGFISGALFFLIGAIYDRFGSKLIVYFSGLGAVLPIFSTCFFLFTLSNIGFPGFSSFISEFVALGGVAGYSFILAFFGSLGLILSVTYSLWLFIRVCFGAVKTKFIKLYPDLNFFELTLLVFFLIPTVTLGLLPSVFFYFVYYDVWLMQTDLFFKTLFSQLWHVA
jgi:NADH-quinone oxidoreductase subunit M